MSLWKSLKRSLGGKDRSEGEGNRLVRDLGLHEERTDGALAPGRRNAGSFSFIDVAKLHAMTDRPPEDGDGEDLRDDAEADMTETAGYIIEDVHLPQTVSRRAYPLAGRVIRDMLAHPLDPPGDLEATKDEIQSLFLAVNDSAQIGDADGCLLTGAMFLKGLGTRQSDSEAMRLVWLAAQKGSAGAEYMLGRLFEEGRGTQKDEEQALLWLEKAATRGLRHAEHHLAKKYEHGNGAPKDFGTAILWYRKAATHGLREAQFRLATILWKGESTRRDPLGALNWYERAADSGHDLAQLTIGKAYAEGADGTRDPIRAAHYLSQAADAGHAEAKVILSHLILEATRPNFQQAERLLHSALEQGYEPARMALVDLQDRHAAYLKEQAEDQSDTLGSVADGFQVDVESVSVRIANILDDIATDADAKRQDTRPWDEVGRALADACQSLRAIIPTVPTDQPVGAYIGALLAALDQGHGAWMGDQGDARGYGSAAFLEVVRALKEIYLSLPPEQRATSDADGDKGRDDGRDGQAGTGPADAEDGSGATAPPSPSPGDGPSALS